MGLRHLDWDGCFNARDLGGLPAAEVRARWGDDPVFATPLYYTEYLDRFPTTLAAVVAAVARARPGGVIVHCAGGRDRTGLVAVTVLTLAGVAADDIVADYALSAERQPARFAALGVEAFLRREGTTAEEAARAFLRETDVAGRLRAAGPAEADVIALRARLLEPAAG